MKDTTDAGYPPLLDDPTVRDAARALRPGDWELTAARATWSVLTEPGDGIAGRLVASHSPVAALQALRDGSGRALAEQAGITPREVDAAVARWRPRAMPRLVAAALTTARLARVELIVPEDNAWPEALADLGDHAPLALWVRGDAAALSAETAVSIVGARAATGYGDHVAMELAGGLAELGVTVVSGAAYGIDGAAHRAALAVGGATVAFLAGGPDRPYPAGHADLLGRIAASGAVVSEAPCGTAPSKWRFLQRNRLIASMGSATVVVEAGRRSGSLNTAGHAATLGRPLGAVPGPVTSATSAGCHRLLREFDAQCITSVEDVRELLGDIEEGPATTGDRTDDAMRVVDSLSARSWRTADDVARRSGLAVAEAEAILSLLALEGAVERGEEGWRLGRTSR